MSAAPPLSQQDIRTSLAVAAAVRAMARRVEADRALSRAMVHVRALGFSEHDIETASRLANPALGPDGQHRAIAILTATGAEVEQTAEPAREQVTDMSPDDFRALLWRQGWFAAVWGRPLELGRWSAPGDTWKRDLVSEGYAAFLETERVMARKSRQAPAKAEAA